jgi:hypothetical protein
MLFRLKAIGVFLAAAALPSCAGAPVTPGLNAPLQRLLPGAARACPCLYVPNPDGVPASVTVYPITADGNQKPLQDIQGSNTELGAPTGIAVDSNANIYVSDKSTQSSGYTSILVYAAGSTGNVAPSRAIRGPATGLDYPQDVAVDPLNGNLYVANGNDTIVVYAPTASGNAAPIEMLGGSKTKLSGPDALTFDADGNLYVSNYNSVTIYSAGSVGNVRPVRTIAGRRTKLVAAQQIALDSNLDVFAVNEPYSDPNESNVTAFAAGAHGDVAPFLTIFGTRTDLEQPDGIAIDGDGNIYVANLYVSKRRPDNSITVYASGAGGNIRPTRKIEGPRTLLAEPGKLTIQ